MNTRYIGKTYKNCDPSGAQKAALNSATSLQTMLNQGYQSVFGKASAMYDSLSSKLHSIVASTHGLDPATLSRINAGTLARSAASENAAQAAVNAKGASTSAIPGVETGVTQAVRGQVISNLETAKNTELGDTAVKDAELGIQERDKALGAEENLGNVFNASTDIAKADLGALGEESAQANANQQASSSWMGLVGGLADSAIGAAGTAAGCVTPETLITRENGEDVPASILQLNDKLWGLDGAEQIVGISVSMQPSVKITLEGGTTITVSESHTFTTAIGGYTFAKDSINKYLSGADGEIFFVIKVEEVGHQPVIRLFLDKDHAYVSNGIWSLE